MPNLDPFQYEFSSHIYYLLGMWQVTVYDPSFCEIECSLGFLLLMHRCYSVSGFSYSLLQSLWCMSLFAFVHLFIIPFIRHLGDVPGPIPDAGTQWWNLHNSPGLMELRFQWRKRDDKQNKYLNKNIRLEKFYIKS